MTPAAADPGALVDALRDAPGGAERLAALLPEGHPVHAGRSAAETGRLRGYLLAAFAETGLPAAALPYVLESLESSDSPDEIAGAALALRGPAGDVPAEVDADVAAEVDAALARAVGALAGADRTVSFEGYRPAWPYTRPTTALTEVARTIARCGGPAAREALAALDRLPVPEREAGPAAPACCGHPPAEPAPATGPGAGVLLEDQDGYEVAFAEYFSGKPAVLAFFYTRCDNPYKCSRTVSTLAHLQDLLVARGRDARVRIAAISYDPEFDRPARLRAYGRDRGVRFGPDVRFFRAVAGFADLRRRLDLGVGYGASTVNRHRIEVYVLDARGVVAAAFTRRQWRPEPVLAAVEGLLER
ncbi:hypothetical protein BJF78_02200 [Pseudonocardia sp. CNS-139]|nr:hypothetical protein BJF78_02200 [Pseudonocardia sp. CNS-139]